MKNNLEKMQKGLEMYRQEIGKLRVKAAKEAGIPTRQFKVYVETLATPECKAEGRMASLYAAKEAGIPLAQFKEFSKLYAKMKKDRKDKKSLISVAEVSQPAQKLLDAKVGLSALLNFLQTDKFYQWYAGEFSDWLAEDENAPSDDQIIQWVSKNFK